MWGKIYILLVEMNLKKGGIYKPNHLSPNVNQRIDSRVGFYKYRPGGEYEMGFSLALKKARSFLILGTGCFSIVIATVTTFGTLISSQWFPRFCERTTTRVLEKYFFFV